MQFGLHTHRHSLFTFAGRGVQQQSRDLPVHPGSGRSPSASTSHRHRQQAPLCLAGPQQRRDRVRNSLAERCKCQCSRGTPAAASGDTARGFGGPELPGDSNGRGGKPLPTQGDAIVEGPGEGLRLAVQEREDDGPLKGSGDLDYLAVS